MPKKLYQESDVQAIADAIREKTGSTDKYKLREMADAVKSISGGEQYSGSYEVVPKIYEAVTLDTADKHMTKNVTVQKVPQYIVGNEADGNTLIIGDEYYGE